MDKTYFIKEPEVLLGPNLLALALKDPSITLRWEKVGGKFLGPLLDTAAAEKLALKACKQK